MHFGAVRNNQKTISGRFLYFSHHYAAQYYNTLFSFILFYVSNSAVFSAYNLSTLNLHGRSLDPFFFFFFFGGGGGIIAVNPDTTTGEGDMAQLNPVWGARESLSMGTGYSVNPV